MKFDWYKLDKLTVIILPIALLVVIVFVGASLPSGTTMVDRVQTAIPAAVLFVTAWYAFLTFQIVRTSRHQTDLMVEQQQNSLAPVIMLKVVQDFQPRSTIMRISWQNIGTGPALSFRCWIEDRRQQDWGIKAIWRSAVGIAVDNLCDDGIIDTDVKDYRLGVGYVRAEYTSVFGIKYESCLYFSEYGPPEFKYGKARVPSNPTMDKLWAKVKKLSDEVSRTEN